MNTRSKLITLIVAAALMSPLAHADDMSGWTAEQIQALTTTQIQAIGAPDFATLTATQVAALTPAQFAVFSGEQVGAIVPAAWAGATADQINAINTGGLILLYGIANLPVTEFALISPSQIHLFGPESLAALSSAQFAALTDAQLGNLPEGFLGALSASGSSLRFSPAKLPLVSRYCIAPSGDYFNTATTAEIAVLTGDQFELLRYDVLSAWSATQLNAVSSTQWTRYVDHGGDGFTLFLTGIPASQIAALPLSTIANLTAVKFASLSTAQLTALTTAQSAAVSSIALSGLTNAQIAALPPASIAKFTWSGDLILSAAPGLSAAQVAAISPASLASASGGSSYLSLPKLQTQAFTSAQLAVVNLAGMSVIFPFLSATQIGWVDPANLSMVGAETLARLDYNQIRALTIPQLQAMTSDQIAGFSSVQLGNMSPAQLAALNRGVTAGGTTTPVSPGTSTAISQSGLTIYRGWNYLAVEAVKDGRVTYASSATPLINGNFGGYGLVPSAGSTLFLKVGSEDGATVHRSYFFGASLNADAVVATLGADGRFNLLSSQTGLGGGGQTLGVDADGFVLLNGNKIGRYVYSATGYPKVYPFEGATFMVDGLVINPISTAYSQPFTVIRDAGDTAPSFFVDRDGNFYRGLVAELSSSVLLFNVKDWPISRVIDNDTHYIEYSLSASGVFNYEFYSKLSSSQRVLGDHFTARFRVPAANAGTSLAPDLSGFAPEIHTVPASGANPARDQLGWVVNGQNIFAASTSSRLTAFQLGAPVLVSYTDPQTGLLLSRYGWTINGQIVLDPTNGTGAYATGGAGTTGGTVGTGGTSGTGGTGGTPTGNPGTPTQGNPNPSEPLPPGTTVIFDQCLNTYVATQSCGSGNCGELTAYGSTPEEAVANLANEVCILATSPGSVIDDYTFNHIHSALDYIAPKTGSGGCASCGGGVTPSAADRDPRAGVVRIHRSRDNFEPSSFGVGVYSSYDISFTLFETAGVTYVDCFNPAWMGSRRYSPSGASFKDAIYNSCKALNLYDASGNLTLSRASAVRGTLVNRDGSSLDFELFAIDANTTGGRPTVFRAIDGSPLLTLAYATTAADAVADADAKRRIASVSDRYANTVGFTYSTLTSGRYAITSASLPGGRSLAYSYDSIGNLTRVDMPGGDASTFTFSMAGNGIFQENFNDAGVTGTHRKKTLYFTNNIAADLLTDTTRPQSYNQASMLVYGARNGSGELTFYGMVNPASSMQRKLYEGGGKLRFTDVANDTRFKTWSAPATIGATNPYASFTGTKEAYGHVAPYENYVANRTHTSPTVTTSEGLVHNFTYDANGNYASHTIGGKTDWHASDARFNKPVLDVDFTGNAVLRDYDAQGNLVKETTGWTMDSSLAVGTTVPGVLAQFYPDLPLPLGAYSGTAGLAPSSVTGMPGISAAYDTTRVNSAIYSGTLTVASAGTRTFYLSSQYYGAKLVIDGQTVLTSYYSSGEPSANVTLTAGTHSIWLYAAGSAARGFSLMWKGPETVVGGTPVKTGIDSAFLSHATVANEQTVRATAAAATKTWTYYPTGHALAGLLQSSTDATGRVSQYAYDANRRLTQVSQTGDAGSLVVMQTLTYDARGNLATTTDAMGRTLTYAYDDRDRRIKTSYGDGTTETLTYGTGATANLVIRQKDRNGSVTKTDYDASGRVVATTAAYALADNDGNFTTVFPESQWSVTTNTYAGGSTNVIRSVTDGKVTEYDYDYKDRVVATLTYPSAGKVLATATAYDATELEFMSADTYGRRTFRAYRTSDMELVREARELTPGSLGALATQAAVLALARDASPNPAYVITDYTKDLQGRVTRMTDPRGVNTDYAYDAAGRTVRTTAAAGLPEAQTSSTAYDAAGRVTASTDALGRVTATSYTPAGRTGTVTLPGGATQQYTYYADGRTATVTDPNHHTSTLYYTLCCGRDAGAANALGQGTLKFYDGEGHVTYAVTVNDVAAALTFGPAVPSAAIVSATTTRYDARGRAVASTRWLVAPTGVDPKNPPIATDATQGLTTTYAYYDDLSDARFAPVLANLAAKGVTLTAGSASVATSPTGEASFSVQDGAGRTVASGVFRKP